MKKLLDKKRFSILVVSHMYPSDQHPTLGIFVHEQVKALRSDGHDVRVVNGVGIAFPNRSFSLTYKNLIDVLRFKSSWDIYDGVPVLRIPFLAIRLLPFFFYSSSYLFSVKRQLKYLKSTFNFKLVHAHTSFLDGNIAHRVSKIYRIPYVITEHTGPFSILTRTTFLRKRTTRSIKHANQLIVVSDSLLGDIIKETKWQPNQNTRIIPNLVNTKLFHIKKIESKKSSRINILWVGHFVPVKRVKELLMAFQLLLTHYIDNDAELCLQLVGSGDDEQIMRALSKKLNIDNQVEFLGKASREDLNIYYNHSDFLVVSSEVETFSVVTIEAMSCGLPVLATRCGGPESIVNNEDVGLLIDKSVLDMVEGMRKMISKLDFFDKNKIRRYIMENYSNDVVVSMLQKEYEYLMSQEMK